MMFFGTFYTLKNPDKKKITVSTNKIKKHNIDIYWLTDWLIDWFWRIIWHWRLAF